MNSVVAIVQQNEIQKSSNKIPWIVELTFLICMHMLNIIEDENGKERNLLRNNHIDQSFLPIDQECWKRERGQWDKLDQQENTFLFIRFPGFFEVRFYSRLLKVSTNAGVGEEGQ